MRALWLAVLALGAAAQTAPSVPPVPRFIDETESSGLQSRFDGEWEYIVGGGVAAFDCDGSGRPSLWLAGGANRARFYRNQSLPGGSIKLTDERSGLELTGALGAYPIDIDGDGHADLAVLRIGETVLMRGLGNCRFERANELWQFNGGNQWATAFSAAWLGNNERPTLALGTYVARTAQDFPWGSCTAIQLFLPTPAPGVSYRPPRDLAPGHCALSMLFSDWNRSGQPALRISNDREYYQGGQEQLWQIAPDGAARLYAAADGWQPLQIWGMGIAAADIDGSGFPAYYLTSMADNKLQTLQAPAANAKPNYRDSAYARGATAHRPASGGDVRPSTAWHAQFADVNNDGWLDLFVVKGNIGHMPDFALIDPSNLLLGSEAGRFTDVAAQAGLVNHQRGRGGLMIDLNQDGQLDAVIVNRWDRARVWRNAGGVGHWLQLRLRQPGGNRDAIGAWLEVEADGRVQRREVSVGGGHASGALGFVHVGLGAATKARVRVRWPGASGAETSPSLVSDWAQAEVDRAYVFDRANGLKAWPR